MRLLTFHLVTLWHLFFWCRFKTGSFIQGVTTKNLLPDFRLTLSVELSVCVT